MASGFPSRDLYGFGPGSALQVPFPIRSEPNNGNNSLKRSIPEIERLQQQQNQIQLQQQQALFLRSVKQRTFLSPDLSSRSLSSTRPEFNNLTRSIAAPAPVSQADSKSVAIKNQLEELERRLLLDDDEDVVSMTAASTSALTSNSDWSSTMQQIISSPPSSSSTVSSTASCSPPPLASSNPKQLLLDAASAVADGNTESAIAQLAAFKRLANPLGDAEQRLIHMMTAALVSRINPAPQPGAANHPILELRSSDHFLSMQMLYELSLPFKLGLIAANFAILEATTNRPNIHILDFEVGQGGHYAAFLQALADRYRNPPALKITAVADPTSPYTNTNSSHLRAVGNRIETVAAKFGIKLQFNVVYKRASELDAESLGCENGDKEALAVNLAFVLSRVADESVSPANPRDELLRRIQALRPAIVTLVEQEINTNTAAFAGRFSEALVYYGALLESLDSSAPRDSPERARVEAGLVRKAVNSISLEGPDRVERCEVFGKWRARMGMAGFQPQPFGPGVIEHVKARFSSIRCNQGFTFKEQIAGVGLGLGWMGRVLTVASAWH